MKNDPVIHAPFSKIVEAIADKIIPYFRQRSKDCNFIDDRNFLINLISTALASLGGEGDVENIERMVVDDLLVFINESPSALDNKSIRKFFEKRYSK